MKLKSLESDLGLILSSVTQARRAAERAATDAMDTAAAHQMAYPVPDSIKARAVSAAVRVARSNTCSALHRVEEVEELVTTLADKVASLKGVTA